MSPEVIDGLAVFLLGVFVGSGEIVSHYRDEPLRALASGPAIIYLTINGMASLAALVALRTFGWTPGGESTPEATRLLQIMGAGFGAMAIFRSSLFVVRVGKDDIGVGPIAFLNVMLGATDRGVDRKRARDREKAVVDIMRGLRYNDLKTSLPAFALQLMQNLSLQESTDLAAAVNETDDAKLPEDTRTLNLGLVLMDRLGESVLRDAVAGLRTQLDLPVDRANTVVEIMRGLRYEDVRVALPTLAIQLRRSLTPDEVTELAQAVQATADPQLPDDARLLNLGLVMMDRVGASVLRDAVKVLRNQWNMPEPGTPRRWPFSGRPKPPPTLTGDGPTMGSGAPPSGGPPTEPPPTTDPPPSDQPPADPPPAAGPTTDDPPAPPTG